VAIIGRATLDRPFFEHGMYIAFSDENYLHAARLAQIKAQVPDVLVFNVAFRLRPEPRSRGQQCALVGTICTPDPDFAHGDALLDRLTRPSGGCTGIEGRIESVDRYPDPTFS
jgi:hypothetical protein